MNVPGRKRGFGIGVGALAGLCAVLLALTALSGCRVYVVGSTPRNPFLGEWHAAFPSAGGRLSYEYVFESDGSYTYTTESASGTGGMRAAILGTYDYDDETLFLTPVPSDVAPSEIEYEFKNDDNMLELRERITTSRTRVVVYHLHS